MNSKIGNLARRRSAYTSDEAEVKAIQLAFDCAMRWVHVLQLSNIAKNQFLSSLL